MKKESKDTLVSFVIAAATLLTLSGLIATIIELAPK